MATAALDASAQQSPSIPSSRPDIACCCGSPSCIYLTHNNAALDDIEEDLRTAAQLGQALLVRHEAYMADAEQSRLSMSARIESLESDKKRLEADNEKTIEENKGLLDQLEDLNTSIADSEDHVKSLEATLHSTQQELRRLEGLAQRTNDLEIQLAMLEQEQEELQLTLASTEDEERSAIQRWKKAERALYEVHDQLEKIEREAREEKERHVEVVERMERQRTVEKELESAAGRLKGAAAATSLKQGKSGSNIVSHFVKDILQDNANLQMGITELRQMLMNSNEEVQALREQLTMHQPIYGENDDGNGPTTLKTEMASKEPQVVSQELHVHHHYHVPTKKEEIRRPKKKRQVINPYAITPPSGPRSPRRLRNLQLAPNSTSTAAAILSQTSISVPSPMASSHRWSTLSGQTDSDFAPSSVPSSPHSMYRNSGLFDRTPTDQAFDYSLPTSPGSSICPLSPDLRLHHEKRGSEQFMQSFTMPTAFQAASVIHEEQDGGVEDVSGLHLTAIDNSTSPNEADEESPQVDLTDSNAEDPFTTSYQYQPFLRRSTSHESILSISGIDIHTLKSRPSQLMTTNSGGIIFPSARFGQISPSTSIKPSISSSMTIAQPTLSRHGYKSTSYLRSSMGLPQRPTSRSSNSSDGSSGTITSASSMNNKTLSIVGGWVWSRWGMTLAPTTALASTTNIKTTSAAPTPNLIATKPPGVLVPSQPKDILKQSSVDPLRQLMGRSPGVNQKGPIHGLRPPAKTPSKVKPERVDYNGLEEVLLE